MKLDNYRKKPVVIQAVQVTVENRVMVADWVNKSDPDRVAFLVESFPGIVISTLEGEMRAEVGDWVVRGVHGEFYPIKPDIFAVSYEPMVGSVTVPDAAGKG